MKKGMLGIMTVLLLACCFAAAQADTSGDYLYQMMSGGRARITGYTGNEKKLVIPSELGGAPVTEIGERAFYNNKSAVSIIIPESVRTIGNEAFARCRKLTGITMPQGVEKIGEAAFANCELLASAALPDSIKEIEEQAFFNCRKLTSAIIPDGVTTIGNFAFQDCRGMRKVSIPGSIQSIPFGAFSGCQKLQDVTIRAGVEAVGEEAFAFCFGLTAVQIPDTVEKISQNAFFHCDNLASINIPDHGLLEGNPFSACGRLTKVSVSPLHPAYVSVDGVLFDRCENILVCCPCALKNRVYEIPQGIRKIGAYAFGGCVNLREIVIPDSVTEIGEGAFKWTEGPAVIMNGKPVPAASDIYTSGLKGSAAAENRVFEEHRYKAQNGTVVDYYIYVPETKGTAGELSVLIYFHGVGDIMERHHGLGELLRTGESEPQGIVILPQAVNETVDADFHTKYYQDAVIELAYAVAAEYDGDTERLSVSGHSDGGVTAYQIVNGHPGIFAACAPISGIGNTDQGIKQTYLWVFQGAKDRWVKPQNGLRVALKCEKAGCKAMHYVYGDEGHDIQTMVYQDVFTDENGRKTKLIDWLMGKKLNR